MIRQSDGEGQGGDLVSEVGNEISVTLDRWSAGQLGLVDIFAALAVVAAGALLALVASRVTRRIARRREGVVRTAIGTIGLLVGSSIMLLSAALAMEVLGFSLGPVLIIVLMAVVALLLARPLVTNLSSGLLLQVRGAMEPGDLIRTNGFLGTVHEINARSVVLDTTDGRRVHVPNADVLEHAIENFTSLGARRSTFDVLVPLSAGVEEATNVIQDAMLELDSVRGSPPPEVNLVAISGSHVRFSVLIWHDLDLASARRAVDAAIRATLEALRREGVDLDESDAISFAELPTERPA